MKKFHDIFLCLAFALLVPLAALADSGLTISNVHFKMTLTDGLGGTSEFLDKCDNDSAHSAPITVNVTAYMTDDDGTEVSGVTFEGQWRVWKSATTTAPAEGSISEPLLTRADNPTEFYFDNGGIYNIAYVGKATPMGEEAIEISETDASSHIFVVKSATSVLLFPNAFSPNGDGINDIYRAKSGYKSIVQFHAAIYNRWGQRLYQWDNPSGGWDGTFNGKPVKDGVYYVQVKALGADGIEYNIKRDVNLMRGYNETDTSTSSQ